MCTEENCDVWQLWNCSYVYMYPLMKSPWYRQMQVITWLSCISRVILLHFTFLDISGLSFSTPQDATLIFLLKKSTMILNKKVHCSKDDISTRCSKRKLEDQNKYYDNGHLYNYLLGWDIFLLWACKLNCKSKKFEYKFGKMSSFPF